MFQSKAGQATLSLEDQKQLPPNTVMILETIDRTLTSHLVRGTNSVLQESLCYVWVWRDQNPISERLSLPRTRCSSYLNTHRYRSLPQRGGIVTRAASRHAQSSTGFESTATDSYVDVCPFLRMEKVRAEPIKKTYIPNTGAGP